MASGPKSCCKCPVQVKSMYLLFQMSASIRDDETKFLVFKYGATSASDSSSGGKKTFTKQSEAIEYGLEQSNNKTFAFEVSKVIRKFIVCDLERFWKDYKAIPMKDRHFYQIIVQGTPLKLFLDIEFWKGQNQDKDGTIMRKLLISLVDESMKKLYNRDGSTKDLIILESSNESKFSNHLIFSSIVFKDIQHCGRFVTQLISSLCESKQQVLKVTTRDGKDSKNIIDTSVYTQNRHLRVYQSSKFGEQRPLNCLNSESVSGNQYEEKNKRILFESLVVNTSATQRNDDLSCFAPEEPQNPGRFIGQGQVLSDQSSPYKNIDRLVERLASPGKIRKVVFNDEKQTVRYDISGNTFCRTKGGNHRKSNIYYKYFAIWSKLIQDCYSDNCKFKKVVEIDIN